MNLQKSIFSILSLLFRKDSMVYHSEKLDQVKSDICNVILFTIAMLSIPRLIINSSILINESSLERITFGPSLERITFVHFFFVITLLVVFFLRKRLSYWFRSITLVFTLYIVGVSGMLQFGILAPASVWFIIIPSLVTILFNTRAGLGVLFFTIFSFLLIATLELNGFIILSYTIDQPPTRLFILISYSFVYLVTGIVLFITISILFNYYIEALLTTDVITKKLRKSNERYKFASLATKDLIWDWDLVTGKIYRSKKGFYKVFGFYDDNPKEKITNWIDYIHPEDRNRVEKLLKEIMHSTHVANFSFEYRFLRPNGGIIHVNDKGVVVRDKKGKAIRMIGAASNITERKKNEIALEESFSNLNAILESTTDGILVVGLNGKILFFNKRFLKLWQIPNKVLTTMDDEKLLGAVLSKLKNPEKFLEKVKELYAHPEASSIDIIELKDGRIFNRYSQPKVMNGQNTGRVWSFRDVTERVNADKEKQQLFALIETSRDVIAFGNLDGTPTFINKAGRKLLGISKTESLSKYNFLEFFPPKEIPPVFGKFPLVFQGKEIWEGDTFLLNLKTNEKQAVSMSAFVIKDNITGKPIGLGNVSMDITRRTIINNELIEAKEEAQKLSGFKDQFLANMSHEIRTPLNGILGFTKILLRSDITKKQKEQLTAIKVSSDILLVVINDILDLAKIEAGKMTLEIAELKVSDVINSIISIFKLRIAEKEQILNTHYDKNIPEWLLGDALHINHVLINLIGNAIKFTENGGTINLSVTLLKQDDKKVIIEISVSDTGIGIAPDKTKNIFEPFIQSNIDTARKYGGSGLGLNIVKQLIDLMKGTITVKSQLHIGSTFTLTIPLIKTPITEIKIDQVVSNNNKLALATQLKGLEQVKILIVDDMIVNQLLAQTILEDIGFETEVATNGKIAIELLEKNNYDIILMDLQMPEMNGWEATQYIRSNMKPPKATMPIIALTADVTKNNAEKCKEAGMDDYVSKPINETDLLDKIIRLVTEKRNTTNNNLQEPIKICNLGSLKSQLGNKPKLVEEMLKVILKEIPIIIKQISKCLDTEDWSSLHGNIHKIKPTLNLIGLPKDIIVAAKQVEEYAREQQHLDLIPALLLKLETALEQAYKELEEELKTIKG
jgi:PAS domain S-box-containing protein